MTGRETRRNLSQIPTASFRSTIIKARSTQSTMATDPGEQVVEEIVYSARVDGKDEMDFGDSTYQRKAQLLNSAIEEIGMGKYQW